MVFSVGSFKQYFVHTTAAARTTTSFCPLLPGFDLLLGCKRSNFTFSSILWPTNQQLAALVHVWGRVTLYGLSLALSILAIARRSGRIVVPFLFPICVFGILDARSNKRSIGQPHNLAKLQFIIFILRSQHGNV